MIARYNTIWTAPPVKECPIKIEFELKKKIIPISFNEDKSVKEYTEEEIYVEKKSKWKDYIESFNLGSPSEQMISHIKKGTPLVTAHTLPHGDYTDEALLKGADIVRQMKSKGITLKMIEEAIKATSSDKTSTDTSDKKEGE